MFCGFTDRFVSVRNPEDRFYGNKAHIFCATIFQRPPHSIELFAPDQVRLVTEYTVNSYFRHFKMYKYAFTPLVSELKLQTFQNVQMCLISVGEAHTSSPEVIKPFSCSTQVSEHEIKYAHKYQNSQNQRNFHA